MDEIARRYYSIGDIANKLLITTSSIRFWLKEFHISVKHNRNGNRYFTPEQVSQVEQIHYLLKVRKFTIEGAKQELCKVGH